MMDRGIFYGLPENPLDFIKNLRIVILSCKAKYVKMAEIRLEDSAEKYNFIGKIRRREHGRTVTEEQ